MNQKNEVEVDETNIIAHNFIGLAKLYHLFNDIFYTTPNRQPSQYALVDILTNSMP